MASSLPPPTSRHGKMASQITTILFTPPASLGAHSRRKYFGLRRYFDIDVLSLLATHGILHLSLPISASFRWGTPRLFIILSSPLSQGDAARRRRPSMTAAHRRFFDARIGDSFFQCHGQSTGAFELWRLIRCSFRYFTAFHRELRLIWRGQATFSSRAAGHAAALPPS